MWKDTLLITLLLVRQHVHLHALACTFHIKRMNGFDTYFPFFFSLCALGHTCNVLIGMIHTFHFFSPLFIYLFLFTSNNGPSLISLSSKKQHMISCSSIKAEYCLIATDPSEL